MTIHTQVEIDIARAVIKDYFQYLIEHGPTVTDTIALATEISLWTPEFVSEFGPNDDNYVT